MSVFFDHRKDSPAIRAATQAFSDTLLELILPDLKLAARGKGYALALHGTRARDIDLLAVPWTVNAADKDELLDALLGALSGRLGAATVPSRKAGRARARDWCTSKAHGRCAILIYLPGMTPEIDLSVMPRTEKYTA